MSNVPHTAPTSPERPEDHLGLIGLAVAKFRIPGVPLADLRAWSDGCIGLLRACALYRPDKAAFSTFAKWCIRSAICDGAKSHRRYAERFRPTDQIGRAIARVDNSDAAARADADNSDWLDWAVRRLPSRWQPIIAARRAGRSTQWIAEQLGVCRETVLTREREAVRFLRNLYQITCGEPRRHV